MVFIFSLTLFVHFFVLFIFSEHANIMYKNQSTIFGLIFTAPQDANRVSAIFRNLRMNYLAAKQWGINRNIHNRPKGGEFMRLGRINAPKAH